MLGRLKHMIDLKGSTILITGAASGIGKALATEFYIHEGVNLVLLDINQDGLSSLSNDLQSRTSSKRSLSCYKCDITDESSVQNTLRSIGVDPIDVLINGAGITHTCLFKEMSMEDMERVLQVNLLGATRMIKALLPNLLQSKKASIINIASLAGFLGAPGMSSYSASKFALMGLSEALRYEYEGSIHVGVICPSFVQTGIAANGLQGKHSNQEKHAKKVDRMEKILSKFGADPDFVAQRIIRSIKSKEELTLISANTQLLYYLNRLSPGTCSFLVRKAFGHLKNTGVLGE